MKGITGYGVLTTAALVMDGKVECVGPLPSRSAVEEWLIRQ